ncbi:hypothetical protein ACLOJK_022798 [Asimina triloba]
MSARNSRSTGVHTPAATDPASPISPMPPSRTHCCQQLSSHHAHEPPAALSRSDAHKKPISPSDGQQCLNPSPRQQLLSDASSPIHLERPQSPMLVCSHDPSRPDAF